MEIKILDLKLKNFKGIKELTINLNCKNANIYGANATGKTTIFDAFKWLFFDKDSSDRKDFNIKTLDSKNNPIHFLEHEVEATLIIDGVDMNFKKVFKEKWVKKRGQAEQEFSGHETNYWIDEVPIKKKDYEEKINNLIPENLFKMITDPLYFNNQLKWQERRELLLNISNSNVSDDEILDSKEEFKILKEKLAGRTIDDYKKVVQSKIKDLNKEKETIPVRIDELTNTLITEHEIDYDEIEKEKVIKEMELQQVETNMGDVQARAKRNMEVADQLGSLKKELSDFKIKKETEFNEKYSKELIKLQNEKSIIESNLRNKEREYEELGHQIETDTKRKDELYKKWDEVTNLKLEFDPNSFICPTCKREYETDKIEEMKKKFEINLQNHKESEKQSINNEGQTLKARIEENMLIREQLQTEVIGLTDKLDVIRNCLRQLNEKMSVEKFDITSLPEYNSKIKEIEYLEEKVKGITNEDISEFQKEKVDITEEINKLNKTLNEKEMQEKTRLRISELEKEEEEISQKVQELESQQFQIEEFTKTKVELLENAINSKFKVVKFRLFKTQINGGLEECCDTLVNGVPYSDVNNAHKILAGLDIINTLIKFYNKSAPIFIDNRESINEIYDLNTQIINLIVTTDKELRIEVE